MRNVLLLIALAGCRKVAPPEAPPTPPVTASSIDAGAIELAPDEADARAAADELLAAVQRGDRHAAYQMMSSDFRSSVSEEDFRKVFDKLNDTYGTLKTYEFRQAGVSVKMSFSGVQRVRKLTYAVATSLHPKGTHVAMVEVVREGRKLVVLQYQIVTFPFGAPSFAR